MDFVFFIFNWDYPPAATPNTPFSPRKVVVFNPKAPKSVYFWSSFLLLFFFFTEAELLFVIGQTDAFSEKNAVWPDAGSAALSPAAGSRRRFVLLIVSFWVTLGKTGLFFIFLLE